MSTHYASARWQGNLPKGKGAIRISEIGFEKKYSFPTRFEDQQGLSPEQLIGAAHAGCFSMAFAHALSEEGFEPDNITTEAEVELVKSGDGFEISTVKLITQGTVKKIGMEKFQAIAGEAAKNCPVSKALKGVDIQLEAKLA
jgi:osmotically inducible protein OsmC